MKNWLLFVAIWAVYLVVPYALDWTLSPWFWLFSCFMLMFVTPYHLELIVPRKKPPRHFMPFLWNQTMVLIVPLIVMFVMIGPQIYLLIFKTFNVQNLVFVGSMVGLLLGAVGLSLLVKHTNYFFSYSWLSRALLFVSLGVYSFCAVWLNYYFPDTSVQYCRDYQVYAKDIFCQDKQSCPTIYALEVRQRTTPIPGRAGVDEELYSSVEVGDNITICAYKGLLGYYVMEDACKKEGNNTTCQDEGNEWGVESRF
jgi:hypothetical protein